MSSRHDSFLGPALMLMRPRVVASSCKVMERLVESGAFRSYDFAVEKSGAKILKALADTAGRDKDHFYCKDVQRIMFRGKAIYNRDAVEG